jgi:hypothetical protein
MVHKSGHHFDLVNWWLDAEPSEVAGMGRLAFYGDKNGKQHGWARDYKRAQGSEQANQDPFAIHIEADEQLNKLYGPDAHKVDGYERDRNVRSPSRIVVSLAKFSDSVSNQESTLRTTSVSLFAITAERS